MTVITPTCALCGNTFICDNGMWFTTCNCAKDNPEELRLAQEQRNDENLKRSAAMATEREQAMTPALTGERVKEMKSIGWIDANRRTEMKTDQEQFNEELDRWKLTYPDRIDEQMARFFFFAGAAYGVEAMGEKARDIYGEVSARVIAIPCPKCHGAGSYETEDRHLTHSASLVQDFKEEICSACGGSGETEGCPECKKPIDGCECEGNG